jgi:putative ABC transport system substrate-binding protein
VGEAVDERRFRHAVVARALLGSCLLAATLAATAGVADAQKIHRVGILETTAQASNAANLNGLTDGLRELGYEVGRNLVIHYRSADGNAKGFPALAAELRREGVDVIVARSTLAATSALKAAPGTPIVMPASGDPVGVGLAKSLARPGGAVTGLTSLNSELIAKRLQLLKEAFPAIQRVGALLDPSTGLSTQWSVAEHAASSLGVTLDLLRVQKAADLSVAFDRAVRQRDEALVVGAGTVLQTHIPRVVGFVATHRLPAIYANPEFVEAGGLMAYSVSFPHLYRRAATYIDRILKGASPGDLPIEQPTHFQLIVNLKTAQTLRLTLPQSVLVRADRIIE